MTWFNTIKTIITNHDDKTILNDNIEIKSSIVTEKEYEITVSSQCIALSCRIDYKDNTTHNEIQIQFYFSPDGVDYDTEPYEIIRLKSPDNIIQKTFMVPVLFNYIRIKVVNTCTLPVDLCAYIKPC
jgi:hypothetical protein